MLKQVNRIKPDGDALNLWFDLLILIGVKNVKFKDKRKAWK